MDEGMDSLGDTLILSTLKENHGLLHLLIADADHNQTATTSHHGLFK